MAWLTASHAQRHKKKTCPLPPKNTGLRKSTTQRLLNLPDTHRMRFQLEHTYCYTENDHAGPQKHPRDWDVSAVSFQMLHPLHKHSDWPKYDRREHDFVDLRDVTECHGVEDEVTHLGGGHQPQRAVNQQDASDTRLHSRQDPSQQNSACWNIVQSETSGTVFLETRGC